MMLNRPRLVDGMPVQDRDLLTRLTHYFDLLETRLAQGQGWLIFNARGQRANWLSRFFQARLADYRPLISSFVMPWRDFALNAYVAEVELPGRINQPLPPTPTTTDPQSREYQLAAGVARATSFQMRHADLLVVHDLRPAHRHELALLETTFNERYSRGRATALLSPYSPDQLAATITRVAGEPGPWERLWQRLYERNLIAL